MASYSFSGLPEVFASTVEDKHLVQAGLRHGKLRRLRRGLYTTNLRDPLPEVVRRNLWQIVAHLCPDAVVSHRTALEGRPSTSGFVSVSGSYDRRIELHGLRIRQLRGPGPLAGDAPFIAGLWMSSRARSLMECLSGKAYGENSPFLAESAIEPYLERLLLVGVGTLNDLRDAARELAPHLGLGEELTRLDAMIGALLGTRVARLQTPSAQARSLGWPYDSNRLLLFQSLFDKLVSWPTVGRPDSIVSGPPFHNLGFFDAYFSNFIEGTEFEVAEAREIVFDNKIPSARPADAHDVLGTYRIVGNPASMETRVSALPFAEFINLLRAWHLSIMQGRPEKRPGEFKEVPNQAGRTLFVDPGLVQGTLKQGLEMLRGLPSPFERAAFLLFLVSEVHPFDDGNGRLARAVANAELVSHLERRILIPTVFRVEYIDSLRVLSREGQPRTFVRMVDQAQDFSADIDFTDFDLALARLRAWNAFETDTDDRLSRPPGL
ncbi:MAG: Fic family protein [Fimbriimonadaceae bacterium]|nr:Fic family protein [Fimbriimonadaceae bacterium]